MVLPKRRERRSSPFLIINLTMTQPLSRTPSANSSFAFSYYQAIVPYVLLITLLCSSTQFAWALSEDKDQGSNLFTDIADNYCSSFGRDAHATEEKEPACKVPLPKLSEDATFRVALAILATSENGDRLQQRLQPILNKNAWKDLKLFYGTPSAPGYHLLSRINRTITALGEAVLASLLATPTSNPEELSHRQHIIQTLLDNPRAVEELESTLQTYEDGEQSFLSLWTKTDPLYSKPHNNSLNIIYSNQFEWMNKSVSWLEFNKRFFVDLSLINSLFGKWILKTLSILFFDFLWETVKREKIDPALIKINSVFYNTLSSEKYASISEILEKAILGQSSDDLDNKTLIQRLLESWKEATPFFHGEYAERPDEGLFTTISRRAEFFAGDIRTCIDIYCKAEIYKQYASIFNNLALRMADVQTFITTATQISETIAASPALEKVYGKHLTSIRQLLAQAEENTELGRLIHYLQHLPLQNWNYFLNNAGKLLASYQLFVEHKDAFADAMYELGQLDAYLSLATLMQEAQANDSNHGYTFVKFLDREQKSTPYIKMDQMWNPFLDAKQAVGNSIEMDGAPGGVRNMILTGPNAGGKSTFLTSVTISLLLSQTFGIAPAQEAVITPFNKINSNIEKGDDIAAAASFFMVEVKRAQQNINIIKGLKPQEFSFTIFDEFFSGTNATEAAAAEYSIFEFLGAYSNSLSIIATHYPTVMRLEELAPDKGFANYQVYITRDSDGKIHYTYKIVPGKSKQAIAIDILEEQGFDVSILQRAREVIAHPEQYQAAFKENSGEPEDLVEYKLGVVSGTEEGEEDAEDLVQYNTDSTASTVVTED